MRRLISIIIAVVLCMSCSALALGRLPTGTKAPVAGHTLTPDIQWGASLDEIIAAEGLDPAEARTGEASSVDNGEYLWLGLTQVEEYSAYATYAFIDGQCCMYLYTFEYDDNPDGVYEYLVTAAHEIYGEGETLTIDAVEEYMNTMFGAPTYPFGEYCMRWVTEDGTTVFGFECPDNSIKVLYMNEELFNALTGGAAAPMEFADVPAEDAESTDMPAAGAFRVRDLVAWGASIDDVVSAEGYTRDNARLSPATVVENGMFMYLGLIPVSNYQAYGTYAFLDEQLCMFLYTFEQNDVGECYEYILSALTQKYGEPAPEEIDVVNQYMPRMFAPNDVDDYSADCVLWRPDGETLVAMFWRNSGSFQVMYVNESLFNALYPSQQTQFNTGGL